jgi:flagellar biosynthesis protein FliQ
MSARSAVARTLLLAYPSSWRREYGAELEDILLSRPIGPLVAGDVIVGGLAERIRSADASTWLGMAALAAVLADLLWNITAAQSTSQGLIAVVARSSKTLPTIVVLPLMSDGYALFLVIYGAWRQIRRGGSLSNDGVATAKITFMAGLPVIVVGILIGIGAIDLAAQRQIDAAPVWLTPWAVATAPLFRLPAAWMLGALGGQIGRWVDRARE